MCAYRTDAGGSSGASGGASCAGPDVGRGATGEVGNIGPLKRLGVSGGPEIDPYAL